MTLSELLSLYRSRKRLVPKTISVYETTIRQLTEFLGREPTTEDLSDETLLRFERWLAPGRSAYTVRERSSRVKALWRFAAKAGILRVWPSVDPPPVPEIRPRAYSVGEVRQLTEAAGRIEGRLEKIPAALFWRAWVVVAFTTGERTGALRRLRWDQVDLERRLLDVPGDIRKGGKATVHYLTPEAVEALRAIRTDSPLVFPWPKSDASFYSSFNRMLGLADLPTGRRNQTQRLRRTHLTYWAAGGGDPTERAGHSSPAVTWKHYLDRSFLPHDRPEDRLPPLTGSVELSGPP